MELFNESLFLKPKKRNSRVYSILDGSVVYVKRNSNILGNVIIIKNKNNLYTIYSQLDRIYNSIKSGKKLKAGTAIGRVNKLLKLKVTRNTTYIDPMSIIGK
jgi:murein DD-endopeptidase MepM/ murein hydrolase activator NlpD